MSTGYTAILKQENNLWIGWIEEILGVNCQEDTCEELMKSLRVTLKEALNSIVKMPLQKKRLLYKTK